MIDPSFRKQVKDVLEHLYDTAYLEPHPLISQINLIDSTSPITRAQRLRSLVKDLIETLRPHEGSPSTSPEWRSYLALRYRFVQGMSTIQVESSLGISLRQLQRETHKGIDAVAMLLWERRDRSKNSDTETTANPVESPELVELQEELNQWVLNRQACEIKVLLDDVMWMLNSVIEQHSTDVQIDLPGGLPPVIVDATLTRQALFKLLRLLASQELPKIHIRHRLSERSLDLVLETGEFFIAPEEPNLQIAQVLIAQQGGRVVMENETITISLPRSDQRVLLVVDDNSVIHHLFERYLAPNHYTVIHAYSGPEALEMAATHQPDFITLDVMMATMDGWQVLRELQKNPATARIPVIVCSVLKEPELALSLGASAYLKKPVERLQLQEALEQVQQAGPRPAQPS